MNNLSKRLIKIISLLIILALFFSYYDEIKDYLIKNTFLGNYIESNIDIEDIQPNYDENSRSVKASSKGITIDFAKCTQDKRRIDVGFGSTTIAVEGKRGNKCRIYYGMGIENYNGKGELPGICDVPESEGVREFSKNAYGVDLTPIEPYCK